ncbi:MAG: L-threonylcarbamoyladenylate synthase [Oscillospiraceae bacterium]|nr:L-threonylcarbamoyladenylate synthase [Oscillospiraceae bacterium]
MKTILLSSNDIKTAAELLLNGEIVAVPTETVYGLAANALNATAVAKIFTAKGRPQDNPLIVHIAGRHQLYNLVENVSDTAVKLMDAFWPGAITMVFPASPIVPSVVTAGLATVAVRLPSHPVMLDIIKAAGVPFAAPSANCSGLPSPTRAEHVLDDLDGKIAAVVDGGACDIGVESTVLDVSGETPRILRIGGVGQSDIERVLNMKIALDTNGGDKPSSPGQKYRHYAPKTPLTVLEDGDPGIHIDRDNETVVYLCPAERANMFKKHIVYGSLSEPESLARGLYSALREADKSGAERIIAVCPKGECFAAVRDRLYRAGMDN